MAPFDECSVLLPSATLEDFPVGGPDADARSLLAGWTVLWHPLLLAQTEQMPTWYRADVPPTPDGPRVIVVPGPSQRQVTADFRRRCDANPQCQWITGADRAEMLSALGFDTNDPKMAALEAAGRTLGVEDFFAAGYLALQVQIMTRRLRYTSNLDELHLQNRIVAAAKAFCERDVLVAAEALHDVFDCLSEERDHYFSSDPHLIDLTLLTPGVLDSAIQAGWLDRIHSDARGDDEANGVVGTPRNVLVDGEVAAAMCRSRIGDENAGRSAEYERFRELLSQATIGWAGGGNAADDRGQSDCLDAMTMASAGHVFESGTALANQAIGVAPTVYARLSGMTPADLIPALAALGYKGVIPIDFTEGTGFGDESKVIVSGGGSAVEALTAKPIDAASDAAFLSLGARLGESIDTGEVSTALLVHWPDRVCDSFLDLCRAASWSVALGRFWTLERYFTDGERPYHQGSLEAISSHSATLVAQQLTEPGGGATLHSMSKAFCNAVRDEAGRTTTAIAMLACPRLLDQADRSRESANDALADDLICQAVGVARAPSGQPMTDLLCFNPQGIASRRLARLETGGPPDEKFIYAATDAAGGCDLTFDVPAMGFTRVSATQRVKKSGLFKRLTGGTKGIAENGMLKNEFMAVMMDEATGGVSGVFSASRGNRLSMRLVAANDLAGNSDGGDMICQNLQVTQSDMSVGILTATGQLRGADDQVIADFTLDYQLQRGSRLLQVDGCLKPRTDIKVASASDLWKNYLAVRTAVAGEAAILRPLVRDKVHSSSTKRFVAPLGVLIDEAEKQTLVTGVGLPLHRKVGDRFLDTLVSVPSEREDAISDSISFQMAFAFDCPGPVAVARTCIAPPRVIAITPGSDAGGSSSRKTQQAWLVHVSSSDVLATEMKAERRRDGKLALRLALIQTRPKSANVKLQFCAFAEAAFIADQSGIERSLEELPENVTCEDGVVSLTLGNHRAVDLIVVFDL